MNLRWGPTGRGWRGPDVLVRNAFRFAQRFPLA
jgi:hypothetical protein